MPMIRVNDARLHQAARVKAFVERRTLMDVVEEQLRAYVGAGFPRKAGPKFKGKRPKDGALEPQTPDPSPVEAILSDANCDQCVHPWTIHRPRKGSANVFCGHGTCNCRRAAKDKPEEE